MVLKVAIIEDSKDVANTLKAYLENFNIEVVAMCHNGNDAVELIKNNTFDLLMLDLILPHIDGLTLLKHHISPHRNYKIICFSAFGNDEVLQESLQLGANYFILKPINYDNIIETIELICKTKIIDKRHINLSDYCFSEKLKGTKYLLTALEIIEKNPEKIHELTTFLYPEVAKRYSVSNASVERSIRTSIEKAWTNGLELKMNKEGTYFKPKIGEMIEYIRRNHD